ncbi:phage tail protein [Synechococcus sp. PCC 7336]|uniref:phage tail protein n=1 Tax=Synechococcus sp. PCC 7336 TaxID=195250 RepID=UPI00034D4F98|nr:phage tail protein [Synechococcus sp. PCC 7336]
MTQAIDRAQTPSTSSSIELTLTPMQVPVGLTAEQLQQQAQSPSTQLATGTYLEHHVGLLAHPGETSEMVLQAGSDGDTLLQFESVRVDGDFPPEWYRCAPVSEGANLPKRPPLLNISLYFAPPANYFEGPMAKGERCRLRYQVRVQLVAADPDSGQRQWAYAAFDLDVRPRSLYLDFLPSLFREVDFIGRFLAIAEQAFEPDVQALDAMWAHLDPLTAPAKFLPFLAYWVGWVDNQRWSEPQRRRLIRQAVEIYRWRGTQRGLRHYLHLYTGLPLEDLETLPPNRPPRIEIRESFARGLVLGQAHMGEDSLLGRGRPFHFAVILRPGPTDVVDEALVRTIIEQEKPAFCSYDLTIAPDRPPPSTA